MLSVTKWSHPSGRLQRLAALSDSASLSAWPLYTAFWRDYRYDARIASGAYGSVHRVVRNSDNVPFALKLLHHVSDGTAGELRALEHFTSPDGSCSRGIVCHRGHFLVPDRNSDRARKLIPAILTDYVVGVDLFTFTEQQWAAHSSPPSPSNVRRLLTSALRALERIHAAGAAHRDVKPENMQVRVVDKSVVLIDLGFTCFADSTPLCAAARVGGTLCYTSPQVLRHFEAQETDRRDSAAITPESIMRMYQSSDVWALGLSFVLLITGETTKPCRTFAALARQRLSLAEQLRVMSCVTETYRMSSEVEKYDAGLALVLRRMTDPVQTRRATSREALQMLKQQQKATRRKTENAL